MTTTAFSAATSAPSKSDGTRSASPPISRTPCSATASARSRPAPPAARSARRSRKPTRKITRLFPYSPGTYTLTRTGAGENGGSTGDLDVSDGLTLFGANASTTIIQAGTSTTNGIDRVFDIRPGATAIIQRVTIRNGRVNGDGGGILTAGVLTLTDVAIESNTATGASGHGGGLMTEGSSQTFLRRVLVAANQAVTTAAFAVDGGGIGAEGATLDLENVTISGNTGNGVSGLASRAITSIVNVTFANNVVTRTDIGGTLGALDRPATIVNSIILMPSGQRNCLVNNFTFPTTLTSLGDNIISGLCVGVSASTDRQNTAVPLGPLAMNGGQTRTHALTSPTTNPAVDTGGNTRCPATDQRGSPRPRDGNGDGRNICDIGAFEVQSSSLGAFTVSPAQGHATPGEPFGMSFTWEVPEPRVWRDLESLSLRLVDDQGRIEFWVVWTEADDRFTLLDASGNAVASGAGRFVDGAADATGVARPAQRPGPGQRTDRSTVTLLLPLVFSDAAADKTFTVQVSARGDDTTEDPFASAATIAVGPAGVVTEPVDDSDDDKPGRPGSAAQADRGGARPEGADEPLRPGRPPHRGQRGGGRPRRRPADRDDRIPRRADRAAIVGRGWTVTVKVGDYVVATGEKVHEQLYDIESLSVEKR